jgi:hypothetical protein
MSATTIRNLINSQIDKQLYTAKKDLRNQGTKQVQKVKEKLPSKDELKEKLISSSCERKAQDKMTKIYDKLIRLLDNLQKIPQKGLDKVKNIDKKLIDFMGEKKRLILGKVKEYAKLALTIVAILPAILMAIEKLFSIMEIVMVAIKSLIEVIKKLKDFVVFLFRNFIKKCNVANQSELSNDGSVNSNLLEEQIQISIDKAAAGTLTATNTKDIKDKMTTLYNDLLEDLKEEGKTKIIERLIRTEDDLQTSYEVKTVPLP